jgi:hypothetical protein
MDKNIKIILIIGAIAGAGYLVYKYIFKNPIVITGGITNNTGVNVSPPPDFNGGSNNTTNTGGSNTTGGSTTPQSTNYPSPQISISPSSIVLNQGATITINGSGFVPNSNGRISGNNIQIAGFTADANGNFNVSASYYFNQSTVSGLGNAIADATGNNISISAYDYGNDVSSNVVNLYFSKTSNTSTSTSSSASNYVNSTSFSASNDVSSNSNSNQTNANTTSTKTSTNISSLPKWLQSEIKSGVEYEDTQNGITYV